MSIIHVRKARREGAPLVIGIAGQSGEGKTYSALKLALGMAAGNPEKVGLLDTENRRGSLYAGILGSPFLIADLYPPFSPERYAQAIKEFEAAGVDVLVIDSITHEWEGDGGCDDIANDTKSKLGQDWKKAKHQHKKFIRAMLQSDMHIICCIRAREKMDFTNPAKPKTLGIQPVCEKNFMYEMTASLMLDQAGKHRKILKCPEALLPIFSKDEYITPEDGQKLREWVSGADGSEFTERLRQRLIGVAGDGLDALKNAWSVLTPEQKRDVGGKEFLDTLKASAEAHEKARELPEIPAKWLDVYNAIKEDWDAGNKADAEEAFKGLPEDVQAALGPHLDLATDNQGAGE